MNFSYPWFLYTPLLYIAIWFATRKGRTIPAEFSSISPLAALPRSLRTRIREPLLCILSILCVTALSIAAARPHRVSLLEDADRRRNIMLVLDISVSMEEQDFSTGFGRDTRMNGVKSVVAEYVRSRSQDRIGLVVFGSKAALQSPLTSDTALVEQLVNLLKEGKLGDGTAIGDGLGVALKRLKDVEAKTKAIILMTDGVNNSGQVNPIKAAHVAKELHIPIHTIGIGSPPSLFGGPMLGNHFDEDLLREVAAITGGTYFNAGSTDGFKEVYAQIENLTASEDQSATKQKVDELFLPFALAGIAVYLLILLLRATYFLKVC
jgi:Ca-activated chloride channel family protein